MTVAEHADQVGRAESSYIKGVNLFSGRNIIAADNIATTFICTTSLGSLKGTGPGTFCATSINAPGVDIQLSIVPGNTCFTVKLTIFIWLIWPAWLKANKLKGKQSRRSFSFFISQ
jgi:hypothetical protein